MKKAVKILVGIPDVVILALGPGLVLPKRVITPREGAAGCADRCTEGSTALLPQDGGLCLALDTSMVRKPAIGKIVEKEQEKLLERHASRSEGDPAQPDPKGAFDPPGGKGSFGN